MKIPGFWITAETVAWSSDVAFSHSLKKDQPQHLQRNSRPFKDGNDTVIVLNSALRFKSDKVTRDFAQSFAQCAKQDVWKAICEKRQRKQVTRNIKYTSHIALFSTTDEENRV